MSVSMDPNRPVSTKGKLDGMQGAKLATVHPRNDEISSTFGTELRVD
jgi:hypothetical protein